MKYHSKSKDETMSLAKQLRQAHPELKLFLLTGDLGSGKTTFVKGIAGTLDIAEREIKSPTFTFVNEHPQLIHYDLYRLEKPDELILAQIHEDLERSELKVIEWPEMILEHINIPHLKLAFRHLEGDEREIIVELIQPN